MEEKQSPYMFLIVNPQKYNYSFNDIEVGDEDFFNLLKEDGKPNLVKACYEKSKQNDIVIGYESGNKHRCITTVLAVSKSFDLQNQCIWVKKIAKLDNPISFKDFEKIKDIVRLRGKTFSYLTKKEYTGIKELIVQNNPELEEIFEKLEQEQKQKDTMENGNPIGNVDGTQEVPKTEQNEPHPLNLILYGPPGTGKTYNTVNEALSIIEGKKFEDLQNENREDVLERFNQYKEKGQIVFTTFHQSLSYEEFIEGIKPIPPDQQEPCSIIAEHSSNASNPKFGNGRTVIENLPLMTYKVTDGIFSKVVKKAASTFYDNVSSNKVDFDDLWDQFYQHIQIGATFKSKIKDQIVADKNKKRIYFNKPDGTINTVHFVASDKLKKLFEKFKDNYSNLQGFNDEFRNVIGGCNATFYWTALDAICEFLKNEYKRDSELDLSDDIIFENLKIKDYIEKKGKPYVLIIDEINRGNVSQIFGELITLIEEDKRLGNKEALTVKLPYSGKDFGVPGNLYIIGTMNTADRSVEALDTALRRRFEFKEMMPNSDLVKGVNIPVASSTFNLKKIMDTINDRIRVLKDREHQIGHSYFMKCKTEEDLKNVFKNNIVPLLQEYFYGNYAYIGLVLGNKFVQKDEAANNQKFATFDGKDSFENNTDTQYKLLDEEGWENLDMTVALQQLIG